MWGYSSMPILVIGLAKIDARSHKNRAGCSSNCGEIKIIHPLFCEWIFIIRPSWIVYQILPTWINVMFVSQDVCVMYLLFKSCFNIWCTNFWSLGSIMDTGQDPSLSKNTDFSTLKSTFESLIHAHYSNMADHIVFRLVSCPPICSESLALLAT